jgi:prepilin-type N-terminal cleavage/methylation domain-containing protein
MIKQNKFFLNKGFTLVEVIVVMGVFSVLIFAITALLVSIIQNPKIQLSAMDSIEQAGSVSFRFANEIRAAAYGTYPLIEAEDSEIIFYSPIGASQGNINRIRYYISGGVLYKGVIAPVNGFYDDEDETITPLLSGVSNGAVPLFYYYDETYNGADYTVPLLQPVYVTRVRYVKMNLVVQYRNTNQDFSTFSISAGSAIRILKDNLTN